MKKEPFIAHSELTNEIYIVVGKEKYRVTEQAIKAVTAIKALGQEPRTFKWCTDCREYDQEKHCCHRWSKAIRDTVEEIKQEYIKREVLDKIRAQIKSDLRGVEIALEVLVENDPLIPKMEGAKDTLENCLEIFDKAESEKQE